MDEAGCILEPIIAGNYFIIIFYIRTGVAASDIYIGHLRPSLFGTLLASSLENQGDFKNQVPLFNSCYYISSSCILGGTAEGESSYQI